MPVVQSHCVHLPPRFLNNIVYHDMPPVTSGFSAGYPALSPVSRLFSPPDRKNGAAPQGRAVSSRIQALGKLHRRVAAQMRITTVTPQPASIASPMPSGHRARHTAAPTSDAQAYMCLVKM